MQGTQFLFHIRVSLLLFASELYR